MCTIKELARVTCHAIPFKRYTSLMTSSIIEVVVYLLNRFPSKGVLYDTLSPSTIVEGRQKVDLGQKKIAFG